jgi:hypothetical protein
MTTHDHYNQYYMSMTTHNQYNQYYMSMTTHDQYNQYYMSMTTHNQYFIPSGVDTGDGAVVRKDIDVNEHNRLSNITLRHKLK